MSTGSTLVTSAGYQSQRLPFLSSRECDHINNHQSPFLNILPRLFMLSLAQKQQFYQIFLAQGLGVGIAIGLLYTTSSSAVSQHFKKKRGFAMVSRGYHPSWRVILTRSCRELSRPEVQRVGLSSL